MINGILWVRMKNDKNAERWDKVIFFYPAISKKWSYIIAPWVNSNSLTEFYKRTVTVFEKPVQWSPNRHFNGRKIL